MNKFEIVVWLKVACHFLAGRLHGQQLATNDYNKSDLKAAYYKMLGFVEPSSLQLIWEYLMREIIEYHSRILDQ